MRPLALRTSAVALLALGLAGCATFDEVEGVPESTRWSYFRAGAGEVAAAARRVLTLGGYTVDAVREGPGGVHELRVTTAPAGAAFTEIRVVPFTTGEYRARAQTVPRGRRLPREIEHAIDAEL